MKKACVAVVLLLLLTPLAGSTGHASGAATAAPLGSQFRDMPSLANISSFIHALPAGMDILGTAQQANLTMELVQATGNIDMLLRDNETWLEDAVVSFYRLHNITVSQTAQQQFFQQTEAMPDALRKAVAMLLVTLNQATVLARQATQNLSADERAYLSRHNQSETDLGDLVRNTLAQRLNILPDVSLFQSNTSYLFSLIEKIDTEKLVEGSLQMVRAVRIATPVIAGSAGYNTTLRDPSGYICIGGSGNDTHTGEAALCVDVGGDDIYTTRGYGEAALCIDAGGSDRYQGKTASSFLGIGMHFDIAGNDVYQTGNWSQSYACGGISFMMDVGGDDSYHAGDHAQACAHAGGIALMVDTGGTDRYHAGNRSQGCSNANAVALLLDIAGDDVYVGGSYVQGSATAGGIALLLDCLGDDQYRSGSNAQGAGEGWTTGLKKMSTGLMVDVMGNDRYEAAAHAQGYGTLAGVGCLTDLLGADTYTATRASQSHGTLFGIAMLMDFERDNIFSQQFPSPGGSEGGTSIHIDDIDALPSDAILDLLSYVRDHNIMPLSSFLELLG
jgi:hypothetical protein